VHLNGATHLKTIIGSSSQKHERKSILLNRLSLIKTEEPDKGGNLLLSVVPFGSIIAKRGSFSAMRSMSGGGNPGGVFGDLWEATRNFTFSEVKGEPDQASPQELHTFRLKALITSVYEMGMREFGRMPASFRAVHSPEDGGQEALLILIEESMSYKPKEGYSYNGYMIHIIRLRLQGIKRKFYRSNPRVGDDLSTEVASMRRGLGREPTVHEIAGHTGLTPDEARTFLDGGYGRTASGAGLDTPQELHEERDQADEGAPSPEDHLLREEFLEIVLDCLDKLKWYARFLMLKRYSERKTYKEISEIALDSCEAIRNQCRRAAVALRECIENRWGKISDFSEVPILPEIPGFSWKEPTHG
jgi:RNA polymerase sigma factor (sigma-70 family)